MNANAAASRVGGSRSRDRGGTDAGGAHRAGGESFPGFAELAAERDQIEARLRALGGGGLMWRTRLRALVRRPRARAELPSLAE